MLENSGSRACKDRPPGKLHILDSGYSGYAGHHYEYTSVVYDEWVGRGGEAAIYAAKLAEGGPETDCNVRRIFRRSLHSFFTPFRLPALINGMLNLLLGNAFYLRDLRKIRNSGFSNKDIILIHTINHSMLPAVYLWYKALPQEHAPYLLLLFRYNNVEHTPGPHYLPTYRIYKFLMGLFDRLRDAKKVLYTTDSGFLAEEYQTLTKKKVCVLPIPHMPAAATGGPPQASAPERIVAVYLGDARDEKGYPLLSEAVAGILQDGALQNVDFIIQSNTSRHSGKMSIGARNRLQALGGRVALIDRSLKTEDYYELMMKADVVVIPYRIRDYYSRTSGIFAEAMALGKPVIIPSDTWMERQLIKYDGGGITFESGSARSLADAFAAFPAKRDELRRKARAASGQWLQFHNPGNYVDMLLQLVGPAGGCSEKTAAEWSAKDWRSIPNE